MLLKLARSLNIFEVLSIVLASKSSDRKFHKGRSFHHGTSRKLHPYLRLSFNKFQAGTNNRESTLVSKTYLYVSTVQPSILIAKTKSGSVLLHSSRVVLLFSLSPLSSKHADVDTSNPLWRVKHDVCKPRHLFVPEPTAAYERPKIFHVNNY